MVFLPLLALVWVAWKVVKGYYYADGVHLPYLGAAFAINSILLVLIAWGLPFCLDRLLKPALAPLLERALRAGLARGLDEVGAALAASLGGTARAAGDLTAEARQILTDIDHGARLPAATPAPALARVLQK